jgi:hypothetical protein
MLTAGLSPEEREAQRQRYIDGAVARAKLMGLTVRCQLLQEDLDDAGHRDCAGEVPGNAGCLCRCHDASAGAKVLRRLAAGAP